GDGVERRGPQPQRQTPSQEVPAAERRLETVHGLISFACRCNHPLLIGTKGVETVPKILVGRLLCQDRRDGWTTIPSPEQGETRDEESPRTNPNTGWRTFRFRNWR